MDTNSSPEVAPKATPPAIRTNAPGAPRSVTENGRVADVRADLQTLIDALPDHAQTAGRRALLTMIDASGAGDDATVNASYNCATGATGQIDITAVVSIRPAS